MHRQPPATAETTDIATSALETHLANLEEQLNLLRAQVRQAQQLASLGTAAATIAHEVNNLLTPILSYAQAALDTGDLDLQKKALSVTVKNVRMLVAMADRVLQINAAKPIKPEITLLQEAATDAVDSLCRDLSKDGITLSIRIDEGLTAWVDPLHLRQVLFNLLLNARQALLSSHSGRITITGRREGKQTVLEVIDTGAGIAPELLPHIFDPLNSSKVPDADEKERCKGLGLALCRDLVDENGGTLNVTSKPGAGTTFTIALPIQKSHRE